MKELWSLLNYLNPVKFSSCDKFMEEFGDLKKSEQVERLHKQLGPYMLRRTKADVSLDIPNKEENIIEIELNSLQKTYYKAILERNREFLQKSSNKSSLINIMMELRKA